MASTEGVNIPGEERQPEHGYRAEENPEFKKLKGLKFEDEDDAKFEDIDGRGEKPKTNWFSEWTAEFNRMTGEEKEALGRGLNNAGYKLEIDKQRAISLVGFLVAKAARQMKLDDSIVSFFHQMETGAKEKAQATYSKAQEYSKKADEEKGKIGDIYEAWQRQTNIFDRSVASLRALSGLIQERGGGAIKFLSLGGLAKYPVALLGNPISMFRRAIVGLGGAGVAGFEIAAKTREGFLQSKEANLHADELKTIFKEDISDEEKQKKVNEYIGENILDIETEALARLEAFEDGLRRKGSQTPEEIERAYIDSLPEELYERLLKTDLTTANLAAKHLHNRLLELADNASRQISYTERNTSLTPKEKNRRKAQILQDLGGSQTLMHLDRIIDEQGNIDALAYGLRLAGEGSKKMVQGMALFGIYRLVENLTDTFPAFTDDLETFSGEGSEDIKTSGTSVSADTTFSESVGGLMEDKTEIKVEAEITGETGVEESPASGESTTTPEEEAKVTEMLGGAPATGDSIATPEEAAAVDQKLTENMPPARPPIEPIAPSDSVFAGDEMKLDEPLEVVDTAAKSEAAAAVTPAVPSEGATDAVEVVTGTEKIESVGERLVQINKGGTASEAAMELVAKAGEDVPISRLIEYDVKLPDGRVVDLRELELVHPGDRLEYIPGEGGAKGHFIFHDESGMKYKTLSDMRGDVVKDLKESSSSAKDVVTQTSSSADFSHPGTETPPGPSATESVPTESASTAKIEISYASPVLEQAAPQVNEAFGKFFNTIATNEAIEKAGYNTELLAEAGLSKWEYANNAQELARLKNELIEFVNTKAGGDLVGSLPYMAEHHPDLLRMTRLMVEYAQSEQGAGIDLGFSAEHLQAIETEIERLYGNVPAAQAAESVSTTVQPQNPFESPAYQAQQTEILDIRKNISDIKSMGELPEGIADRNPIAVLNHFTTGRGVEGIPLESKDFIFYCGRSYDVAGFSPRQIDEVFKSAVDKVTDQLNENKTLGRIVDKQEVAKCVDAEFTPPGDARTPRSIVFRFSKERLAKLVSKQ